ncbi:MAG: lasso peptide biosynthesis B2 protein [Cyanobacteria bacterium P01_A01_bin.83]
MKQLIKLLQLTAKKRQLLIDTYFLLTAIRLGLWLLTFKTLRQRLAKLERVSFLEQDAAELNRVIWAVNLASRYQLGGVKCLARALTTQLLLSRRGYPTELRIGVVKTENDQLLAHAWVESNGEIVMGAIRNLAEFKPFPAWEGSQL